VGDANFCLVFAQFLQKILLTSFLNSEVTESIYTISSQDVERDSRRVKACIHRAIVYFVSLSPFRYVRAKSEGGQF